MFKKEGFSPVSLQGGPKAPRVFVYANDEDTIEEITKPGYFNGQKIILLRNSFIKVVCKDAIAEIVVLKNSGDVTFYPNFESIEIGQPRGEGGQFAKKKTG